MEGRDGAEALVEGREADGRLAVGGRRDIRLAAAAKGKVIAGMEASMLQGNARHDERTSVRRGGEARAQLAAEP